jgi:hypothetical protein
LKQHTQRKPLPRPHRQRRKSDKTGNPCRAVNRQLAQLSMRLEAKALGALLQAAARQMLPSVPYGRQGCDTRCLVALRERLPRRARPLWPASSFSTRWDERAARTAAAACVAAMSPLPCCLPLLLVGWSAKSGDACPLPLPAGPGLQPSANPLGGAQPAALCHRRRRRPGRWPGGRGRCSVAADGPRGRAASAPPGAAGRGAG